MKKLIIVFFSLNVLECNPTTVTPAPTPIVRDTEFCKPAEENLIKLNCPEGKPTKKGMPFSQFCLETQNNGVFLNPKCLSEVKECSQVDYCTRTKTK